MACAGWTSILAVSSGCPLSSGILAGFDRRKCKGPLNGPAAATGLPCPEGWTLYPFPGPQFDGVKEPGSAESVITPGWTNTIRSVSAKTADGYGQFE